MLYCRLFVRHRVFCVFLAALDWVYCLSCYLFKVAPANEACGRAAMNIGNLHANINPGIYGDAGFCLGFEFLNTFDVFVQFSHLQRWFHSCNWLINANSSSCIPCQPQLMLLGIKMSERVLVLAGAWARCRIEICWHHKLVCQF